MTFFRDYSDESSSEDERGGPKRAKKPKALNMKSMKQDGRLKAKRNNLIDNEG